MYAIDSPAVDSCIRDHSDGVYFRIDLECMARAEYVGLQQYAGKCSWSDMPSVHDPLVFLVSHRDNPG